MEDPMMFDESTSGAEWDYALVARAREVANLYGCAWVLSSGLAALRSGVEVETPHGRFKTHFSTEELKELEKLLHSVGDVCEGLFYWKERMRSPRP